MARERGRRKSNSGGAETTPELTGKDADRDGAEPGNVGSGEPAGDPDDIENNFRLESDPTHPEDLPPDHLEEMESGTREDDPEITARPKRELRPLTPDLLP